MGGIPIIFVQSFYLLVFRSHFMCPSFGSWIEFEFSIGVPFILKFDAFHEGWTVAVFCSMFVGLVTNSLFSLPNPATCHLFHSFSPYGHFLSVARGTLSTMRHP